MVALVGDDGCDGIGVGDGCVGREVVGVGVGVGVEVVLRNRTRGPGNNRL